MPGKGNAGKTFPIHILDHPSPRSEAELLNCWISWAVHRKACFFWSSSSPALCGQSHSWCSKAAKSPLISSKLSFTATSECSLSYSTSTFLYPRQKDGLDGSFLPNPHVVAEEGACGKGSFVSSPAEVVSSSAGPAFEPQSQKAASAWSQQWVPAAVGWDFPCVNRILWE